MIARHCSNSDTAVIKPLSNPVSPFLTVKKLPFGRFFTRPIFRILNSHDLIGSIFKVSTPEDFFDFILFHFATPVNK